MSWCRLHEGTSTDPKWPLIARRANVATGVVVAVWTYLLDIAQQADDRGSVADFDAEVIANFYGWEEADIEAVYAALKAKGLITPDDRLTAWEKRQVKREDDSAERVREYRARKRALLNGPVDADPTVVTHCNAIETHGNAQIRVEKIREDKKEGRCAELALGTASADREDRGSDPRCDPPPRCEAELPLAEASSDPPEKYSAKYSARPGRRRGRASAPPGAWEAFKAAYPHRGGRAMGWPEAEMRFKALIRSGAATAEQLLAAAERYAAAMANVTDRELVQQASTFLGPRKQTWREYLARAPVSSPPAQLEGDERWRRRLNLYFRLWRDNPQHDAPPWDEAWGPRPGEPGCRVPRHLIEEVQAAEPMLRRAVAGVA